MTVHWMRYLVGDAGNLQRTYLAVKTASEYQLDNMRAMCEIYLRKYSGQTTMGERKRGLTNSEWRSAEPHFSFARELDLLDGRNIERWGVSFGAGRTFLNLWNSGCIPATMLLNQLLTYDRSFLLPFLVRLVETEYDFSTSRYKGLEPKVREVWQEIWQTNRNELMNKEPPLPDPKQVKDRTLLHHAASRIRFLSKMEGLGLNIEKLRRITEQFAGFEETPRMPQDSFRRIKIALTGEVPKQIQEDYLKEAILEAFNKLQRGGHVSAYGTFLFVNERIGENVTVDWNNFADHVRKKELYSKSSSFRRDDQLLSISPELKAESA